MILSAAASSLDADRVTVALGWLESCTWKVAEAPSFRLEGSDVKTKPWSSSSVIVTVLSTSTSPYPPPDPSKVTVTLSLVLSLS